MHSIIIVTAKKLTAIHDTEGAKWQLCLWFLHIYLIQQPKNPTLSAPKTFPSWFPHMIYSYNVCFRGCEMPLSITARLLDARSKRVRSQQTVKGANDLLWPQRILMVAETIACPRSCCGAATPSWNAKWRRVPNRPFSSNGCATPRATHRAYTRTGHQM